MADETEYETIAVFEQGANLQQIIADLAGWGHEPSSRMKIKRAKHDHSKIAVQVCTDTWGGGNINQATPCPGNPACT